MSMKGVDFVFKYDRNNMYIIQKYHNLDEEEIQKIYKYWENNILFDVKQYAEMLGVKFDYTTYTTKHDNKCYIVTEIKGIPEDIYHQIAYTFKLLLHFFSK